MEISEKLLKMKKKIEDAKINVSRLEGSAATLYKALKKEFECNTLEDAEKKVKKIGKDLDKKETALAKGIASLQEKYDWD